MKPDAEFARQWIDAWNAHDLERILSPYAPDVVFRSPVAAQVVPDGLVAETLRFGADGLVTEGFAAYEQ